MLGVQRKLGGQKNAFERLLDCPVEQVLQHGTQLIFDQASGTTTYALRRGLDHYHSSVASAIRQHVPDKYQFIYVRFPSFCDLPLLKILSHFKHSAVIMEIPTYPLAGEWATRLHDLGKTRNFVRAIQLIVQILVHTFTRWRLKKYVDCLVCIGNAPEKLWGMKVFHMANGYSVEDETPLPQREASDTSLNLVCVASLQNHHGLDRLIRGMAVYQPRPEQPAVHLDVVGEGPELQNLKSLVEECGLQSQVTFHGFKSGAELRAIYENSDIGVASLGLHRIGCTTASVLKGREYCSLGLPYVYAYFDPAFDTDLPFCLRLESSEEPIDIENVVQFWTSLKSNGGMRTLARHYAEEHLTWTSIFRPVLSHIQLLPDSSASTSYTA